MDIFAAIAEPSRRKIIEMLATRGRLSATEIGDKFSMSAPAISQHLKVLREAGLVCVEKQGQLRIYELDMKTLYELERWTQSMTSLWNARLDRLGILLENRAAAVTANVQNRKKSASSKRAIQKSTSKKSHYN